MTFPDLPTGAPLGIGLGAPFEAVELELPEGSLLALYTDGLIETRDHDIDVGMERLGAALAQPGRSLEDLCTLATETLPGQEPCDDVTLLLVRTRSISPGQVASWTLPSDETAVHSARHMAACQLAEWGLEGLEDATKLIVSELVTNAVRHSTSQIGLRLIHHQVLTCEVFDTNADSPSCVGHAPQTRTAAASSSSVSCPADGAPARYRAARSSGPKKTWLPAYRRPVRARVRLWPGSGEARGGVVVPAVPALHVAEQLCRTSQ